MFSSVKISLTLLFHVHSPRGEGKKIVRLSKNIEYPMFNSIRCEERMNNRVCLLTSFPGNVDHNSIMREPTVRFAERGIKYSLN